MKIFVWPLKRTHLVLLAAALAAACDANHVLGIAPPSGSAGMTGAAGSAGVTGVGGGSTGRGDTTGVVCSGGSPWTPAGAAGTGEAPASAGTGGTPEVKADAATLGRSETWTGYVENHMFNSGSDAIVLTFATDANGVVKGTIVFGSGTPPPPATDPNVGYPPELWSAGYAQVNLPEWLFYLSEGYPYAFDGGTVDSMTDDTKRVRLSFDPLQLWVGWCALQTQASDCSDRCVPHWEGSFSSDSSGALICTLTNPKGQAKVPIDCSKFMLCGVGDVAEGVCSCTPSGCSVRPAVAPATVDVFITGATGSGSAKLPPFETANIHFIKAGGTDAGTD